MKRPLAILPLFLLAASPLAFATTDTSATWESVAFDAGGHRVEIKAPSISYKITSLKIWISGKAVRIPRSDYEQISNPALTKVVVVDTTRPRGSTFDPESDLEVPFQVLENGSFKDGGTWVFRIVNGKYLGKWLRSPEPP